MKILLFGGAFDPPHEGHRRILKKAIEKTAFDHVIVMPTGTPTHKQQCMAPFAIRYYLAQTAFLPLSDRITISDYEGKNGRPDYTYQTIDYLQNKYEHAEIFLLMGSDSLFSLQDWKNSAFILQNCTIMVFCRDVQHLKEMNTQIAHLKSQGVSIVAIENQVYPVSSSVLRSNEKVLQEGVDLNTQRILKTYDLYNQHVSVRLLGTCRLLAKLMLDEKRYVHTLNVEKLAITLAELYQIDQEKVRISALLHDILKNASADELLHRAQQSDIISKIDLKPFPTLHGFAAADYAKRELGIQDADILWALKSHTCGRADMTDIEKIIYLADMLCEERQFEAKERLLSYAKKDLNLAMYHALQLSIAWVKSKGKSIDNDSQEALDYFEKLVLLKEEIE